MLRVLLDATAVPENRGGVGRYVDNLVPELAALTDDLSPRLVCRPADRDHYEQLSGQRVLLAPKVANHPAARLAWEQSGFPALLRHARPDVLHSPHYTRPVAAHCPVVVTLHDATFFSDPNLHGRIKGPFFRQATALALRGARRCLVPSQATAAELTRLAGARPDRLDVAHLGVDTSLFRPASAEQVIQLRATLGLGDGEQYVAFLGTLEPRKNIPALIRGWVQACAQRPDPPALVLAGASGWDTELDAALRQVPSRLRVIRPGYLPLAQLPALLSGADVVAYPSLGEGFGLPVLEAMACGAPVLTTRRLALPEIGGDAVAYCEVDAASIGTELTALLSDPIRRRQLQEAGVARAAQFSWAACAAAHLASYRAAV